MEKLLSIILPIYNGERYVSNCVNSLLRNTYGNYEIILVENGSTDRSNEICRSLEASDERIRFAESPKGLCNARNKGLAIANGEYIAFVDVDDYIASDIYTQMIDAIEQTESDLAMCGYVQGNEGNYLFFNSGDKRSTTIISQDDYYRQCFLRADFKFTVVWNKIFKLSIIRENSIYFDPDLKCVEDREYMTRYILHCSKICCCNDKLYYYYRGNPASICNDTTNMSARMDQIHSLQKSLLSFKMGTKYYEYVNACLLQNADFRLRRAIECNLPEQVAELKPVIELAEEELKNSKFLDMKTKYRFLLEHSSPKLFNMLARIMGKC